VGVVPGEVALISRNGQKWWARYTGIRDEPNETYQYRVNGMEMIVVKLHHTQLSDYCRNGKPIPMPECL